MKDKARSLDVIKGSLEAIGYNNKKIIDKYPVTNKNGKIIYFDLVAFGDDRIQDTSTSCISVKYCDNESDEDNIIEDAKCLATPLLMLPRENNVKLLKLNVEKKSEKIIEIQYDELSEYFSENRVKYEYNQIVPSKYERKQLSFFDLDTNNLFLFASKINCKLLEEEFKNALKAVETSIDINKSDVIADITGIIMHIIAAKILNDKLMLKKKYNNIHKLLSNLEIEYEDYFDLGEIYKYGEEVVNKIVNSFNKSLSYRSIDNKILGKFYENTLFESSNKENQKIKRELGIYYTPTCLVNKMLEFMPIEMIDYRERYVLDASCGSGSLLIGMYNRLKELLPKKMDEKIKHKYLTDMILGIDVDKFACEVAKLELLLNSIPYGNGWNIVNEDFLKINNLRFKPKIIIANPPYKEKRKEKIEQKASVFLDKYIDILADGGIIGIILPQSFLANESCIQTREKLLKNIKIYEIWMLPKGVFDTNNCSTTVIIGKKEKRTKDNMFKGRIVVKKSVDNFINTGKFDIEFLCKSQNKFLNEKDFKLTIFPLDTIINKLEKQSCLKDYVKDTQGIQIPYKTYPFIFDTYKNGCKKYFRNAKRGISEYNFDWSKQNKSKYILYDPENLINKDFIKKGLRLRDKNKDIFESPKVVIPINSTPGTFWRVKAAIDYEGIYVSHSLWCFIPNDKYMPLEVIAAVLNSKITNLYIESKNPEMSLTSENIRNTPFPKFTDKQKNIIVKCVKDIENNINILENKNIINDIVYKAFELSQDEIDSIEFIYSKFINGSDNIYKDECNDTVQVGGLVDKVDLENNIIKAQFVELYEEKLIKINENIPGWLLAEKGIQFKCNIEEKKFYDEEVEVTDVVPIQYTYLNDNKINDLKYNHFNDYKIDRHDYEENILKGEL